LAPLGKGKITGTVVVHRVVVLTPINMSLGALLPFFLQLAEVFGKTVPIKGKVLELPVRVAVFIPAEGDVRKRLSVTAKE
jgi:hypothetical protein